MAKDNKFDQLEWVQTPGEDFFPNFETGSEKFVRKFKENPFVPIGLFVTSACLFVGIRNFSRGNTKYSQLLMRARVISQGLTFMAIIGGMLLAQKKK